MAEPSEGLQVLEAQVASWHRQFVLCDCWNPADWKDCRYFTVARLQAPGGTAYLVMKPAEPGQYRYVPVVINDEDYGAEVGEPGRICGPLPTYGEGLVQLAATILRDASFYPSDVLGKMKAHAGVVEILRPMTGYHVRQLTEAFREYSAQVDREQPQA